MTRMARSAVSSVINRSTERGGPLLDERRPVSRRTRRPPPVRNATMLSYRIISIGALSAHPLWNERHAVRTGHATTTLITAGEAKILVDPSLPESAVVARLGERANVKPDEVTHVFLTSFEPERRRAINAFPQATWYAHEPELEVALQTLRRQAEEAELSGDEEMIEFGRREQQVLKRMEPAPDRLIEGVDLFPLPGFARGSCGLLLPLPGMTILIAGDTIATHEHMEEGKVLPDCDDLEQAQESFREAIEIADIIVPGRDNVILNPLRRVLG